MYIVYRHINLRNGKFYIGLTNKTLDARWIEHQAAANRGSRFAFHCAIRKYGSSNWRSETLAKVDNLSEAKRIEVEQIAHFNSMNHGYNMTSGGDGFRGLKRTAKHRKAISDALQGHSVSERTKGKLRQYRGEKASFYGRKHSKY